MKSNSENIDRQQQLSSRSHQPMSQEASGARSHVAAMQQGPDRPVAQHPVVQNSPRIAQLHAYSAIANGATPIQRQAAPQGGLPTQLQSGIESLSGIAMHDVRVHYNSSKPAQLQAHAYAQGTDIHIAPGQERHLPHEAWHVVQQKQGRVKPTLQLKGIAINDDSALEREADEMGARAMGPVQRKADFPQLPPSPRLGVHQYVVAQREPTAPTVTTGVDIALTSDFKSFSLRYALTTLRKLLSEYVDLVALVEKVLGYAIALEALPSWAIAVKAAYDALKKIAKIPEGVISIFLWAVGKMFMTITDYFYNNTFLARKWGTIEEKDIYAILAKAITGFEAFGDMIAWIDSTISHILWFFSSGNTGEDEDRPAITEAAAAKKSSHFVSLNVEAPKLEPWDDAATGAPRAGLQADASAYISIFGQKMGGDLTVQLPFGSGWQASLENFFESSPFDLEGFSVGKITGDQLIYNDQGLVSASMSIHDLKTPGDLVAIDAISVIYYAADESIFFKGQGSAKLWGDKRIDGEVHMMLGLDGKLLEAGITVAADATFEAIPDHLDIVNPGGQVTYSAEAPPVMHIHSGIAIKGLPLGLEANALGGVHYETGKLSGYLTNLDITLPIGEHGRLTIVVLEAAFDDQEVTAKKAYIDFDFDKIAAAAQQEPVDPTAAVAPKAIPDPKAEAEKLLDGDLAWLDISAVADIDKLSVRQGLSDLKLKDGKFSFKKDADSGLRSLKARALGVGVEYNAESGTGSLSGKVGKEIKPTLLKIDFPVLPGVGGFLQLDANLGFEAMLAATVSKIPAESSPETTAMLIHGEANATARAGIKLSIGAFAGIPYLATIKGGLYGEALGTLSGSVAMGGKLHYDHKKAKILRDAGVLPSGDFALKGALTAQVGAELKAQFLFFEKEIARLELGDWELGSYELTGKVTSDAEGKPVFTVNKSEFEESPKPPRVRQKVVPIHEWIENAKTSGQKIDYEGLGERAITKVAREIVWGNYDPVQKTLLWGDYAALLIIPAEKQLFHKLMLKFEDQARSDSFIWSATAWDTAVNRLPIIGRIQSRSKSDISDFIAAYHALKPDQYSERLKILDEIDKVLIKYITERSKTPDNIKEAEQMQKQILLERDLIASQQEKV